MQSLHVFNRIKGISSRGAEREQRPRGSANRDFAVLVEARNRYSASSVPGVNYGIRVILPASMALKVTLRAEDHIQSQLRLKLAGSGVLRRCTVYWSCCTLCQELCTSSATSQIAVISGARRRPHCTDCLP